MKCINNNFYQNSHIQQTMDYDKFDGVCNTFKQNKIKQNKIIA